MRAFAVSSRSACLHGVTLFSTTGTGRGLRLPLSLSLPPLPRRQQASQVQSNRNHQFPRCSRHRLTTQAPLRHFHIESSQGGFAYAKPLTGLYRQNRKTGHTCPPSCRCSRATRSRFIPRVPLPQVPSRWTPPASSLAHLMTPQAITCHLGFLQARVGRRPRSQAAASGTWTRPPAVDACQGEGPGLVWVCISLLFFFFFWIFVANMFF